MRPISFALVFLFSCGVHAFSLSDLINPSKFAQGYAHSKNHTSLLFFSVNGDLQNLKRLVHLAPNLDIDFKSTYGYTPLHLAILYKRTPVSQFLIEQKASVNMRTPKQETPLHLATQRNLKEVVLSLINHGANIEATDDLGNTPLHWASRFGSYDVADVLISKGANVNAKNKRNDTPLHFAGIWKRLPISYLLILEGADLKAQNNLGNSPFSSFHENFKQKILDQLFDTLSVLEEEEKEEKKADS